MLVSKLREEQARRADDAHRVALVVVALLDAMRIGVPKCHRQAHAEPVPALLLALCAPERKGTAVAEDDRHQALTDFVVRSASPLSDLVLREDSSLTGDLPPLLLLDQVTHVIEQLGIDGVGLGDVRLFGQDFKFEERCL